MVSFVNFARTASICEGFHLGILHGYFFHYDFWPNLNFPLEYPIKLVLKTNNKNKSEFQNLPFEFCKFLKMQLIQVFKNHKNLKNSSIWPKLAFLPVNQTVNYT